MDISIWQPSLSVCLVHSHAAHRFINNSIDWGISARKNPTQDLTNGWEDLVDFEDALTQDLLGQDTSKVGDTVAVAVIYCLGFTLLCFPVVVCLFGTRLLQAVSLIMLSSWMFTVTDINSHRHSVTDS